MGKIYVPICGPTESKRAINKAVKIAREMNLELVAINVIDMESIAKLQRFKIFVEEESAMFSESMRKDAQKYLNYVQKVGDQYGIRVSTVLLEGDPFTEIAEYIRNDKAGMFFVCVAKKKDADLLKEVFGNIEKKLLMKTNFDIIVVGEDE